MQKDEDERGEESGAGLLAQMREDFHERERSGTGTSAPSRAARLLRQWQDVGQDCLDVPRD